MQFVLAQRRRGAEKDQTENPSKIPAALFALLSCLSFISVFLSVSASLRELLFFTEGTSARVASFLFQAVDGPDDTLFHQRSPKVENVSEL